MLIEFRVKNFRSFHGEAVLSMVAGPDKSLPENSRPIPTFGNRRLLHSAVVYGANAAGKSNLISAVYFMRDFIKKSTKQELNAPLEIEPFLLTDSSLSEISEFEITYIDDLNIRYQYGFQLTQTQIEREWLVAYPKGLPQTWFERGNPEEGNSTKGWYFSRNLKGANKGIAAQTRPNVLFLSNAANLNHQQLGYVYTWFQKSIRVLDSSKFNPTLMLFTANKSKEDEQQRSEINQILQVADLGISGFDSRIETYSDHDIPMDTPDDLRSLLINKQHLKITMHHKNDQGGIVPLAFEEESNGTQRIFALSGPLINVLKNGQVLLVDELDSSLHPILVRYLVELFHNPQTNPKGAQLIFNTHDTTLLDSTLLRRDQIWFVEKDRQGCSHLYSLLEYSPRKGESLAKGYLQGRYGAIPFLGELNLGEKGDGKE